MKSLINTFLSKLVFFLRKNWWIPILYILILLLIIFLPGTPGKQQRNIFNLIFTSSLHFVADIFILMMIEAYQKNDRKVGSFYQFIAMALFTGTKLYSGIAEGVWSYFYADPAFIIAGLKNYYKDVLGKNFIIDKLWKALIISVICFVLFFLYINKENPMELKSIDPLHWGELINIIGLLMFATGLFISDDVRLSDKLIVLGLILVVLISVVNVAGVFIGNTPSGLQISHFVLPLAVLIYKLRTLFESK